ncbi:hypothetical protein ZWY2020_010170 [Hordeum vulgare]|nr:hypothetical protein ZWY2020_010170 [Hordeum vulgare]
MPRVPRRPSDEARRGAYKPPGVDAARSRRRREDRLLALRRRNRDAGLFKRRREEPSLAPAPVAPPSDAAADATAPPPPPGPSSPPSSPPPADALRAAADAELEGLSEMVDKVWSDDTTSQLEATVQFRKLLSDGKNSTMIKIIRADVLPRFAEFLSRQRLPQLQMEAAWVLTNIAAHSPNANIRHQALWALGNIAADMPSCREIVLDHGAVTPLLAQFKEDMKVSVLRTATWALSNLCFGKLPAEVQVKPILEIISLLIHSADEKILADACWALYYICDGVEGGIQDALDAGVCPQLVKLLMHASANILLPVITSLARISAGDDTQVQVIIENGILPCLTQLLARNYPKIIKKQTCLIVSNITAGSKDQIQAVIDADVMNHVIVLLKTSETDLKKEAAWAISNAASGGSSDQIQYLVSRGCLEPLCNVLKYQDVDLVYTCLEGLQNILEEVYKLAMKLLERYWDEEVSDEANLTASKDSPAENVEAVPEDAAPPPVAAPSVDGTE